MKIRGEFYPYSNLDPEFDSYSNLDPKFDPYFGFDSDLPPGDYLAPRLPGLLAEERDSGSRVGHCDLFNPIEILLPAHFSRITCLYSGEDQYGSETSYHGMSTGPHFLTRDYHLPSYRYQPPSYKPSYQPKPSNIQLSESAVIG